MANGLATDHKAPLRRRFDSWAAEQELAVRLRSKLLDIDGLEIVAPPNNFESDIEALIAIGSEILSDRSFAEMREKIVPSKFGTTLP